MLLGEHCSTDGVNLGTDEDPDLSNDPGTVAGVGRLQDGDKRPNAGPQDWAGMHILLPFFAFHITMLKILAFVQVLPSAQKI